MADRIFAGILLLLSVAYTFIAFTLIKAPFQYDPLGPESWPRILGLVAIPCCLFVLAKPDVARLGVDRKTLARLTGLIFLLFAYAHFFEPLGFIVATWAFCTVLSAVLGARLLSALAFGAACGIIGYFVCTQLLNLNLPDGILEPIL